MVLVLGLVTVGEGVGVGVMDEAAGAVTPGEGLGADPHVVVGVELWPGLMLGQHEGVDVAEDHDGDGGEDEGLLPHQVASVVSRGHLPHGAHGRRGLSKKFGAILDQSSHG